MRIALSNSATALRPASGHHFTARQTQNLNMPALLASAG